MTAADPVLAAWHAVRAEQPATCPLPSELAIAAYRRPEALALDQLGHLLEARCERCESALLALWEFEDPSPATAARRASYREASAFGAALRTHLGLAAAPARPSFLASKRWAALVERLGESVIGHVVMRPLDTGLAIRSHDPAALPPQSFGAGVVVEQNPEDPASSLLFIDARDLEPELRGRRLLVVFQDQGGAILASHELAPFESDISVTLAGDPAALTASGVDVLIFGAPDA